MALLTGQRLRPRTRFVLILLGGLLALILGRIEGEAQTPVFNENEVKATFLFYFAQFVEWPPRVFPEAQTPITIGVLGDDVFGPFLDKTVRGEVINNRTLAVQRYRHVEEVGTCHVLFISASEAGHLDQILGALKGRPILTVGDAEGFARQGVMIRFVTEKNKIRLHVNLEAAKDANLQLSSKLLRSAEIVGKNGDR